jgi:hypothetical protein
MTTPRKFVPLDRYRDSVIAFQRATTPDERRLAEARLAETARPIALEFGHRLANRYGFLSQADDLFQNIWIVMTTDIPVVLDQSRPILPLIATYARNQALSIFSRQLYAAGRTSRDGWVKGIKSEARMSSRDRDGLDPELELSSADMLGDAVDDDTYRDAHINDAESAIIDDIDRRSSIERLRRALKLHDDQPVLSDAIGAKRGPKIDCGAENAESVMECEIMDGDKATFMPINSSPMRKRQMANKADPELQAQVARLNAVQDMLQISAREFAAKINISYALLVAYHKFRVQRIPPHIMRAVEAVAKSHRSQFKTRAEWETYVWLKDAPIVPILARWAEALGMSVADIKGTMEKRFVFADSLEVPRQSVGRWLIGQKPALSRIVEIDRRAARLKAQRLAAETRRARMVPKAGLSSSPVMPRLLKIKAGTQARSAPG